MNRFCKEYSNDAGWLTLSEKKWSTKETFKAYSHGKKIKKELEKLGGGSVSQNPPKESDLLKKTLRRALNKLLVKSWIPFCV
jgi:hypothetical protein